MSSFRFLFYIGLRLCFFILFLHRYASHQMYTTTKGWERVIYLLTWFTLGSSYLVPSAYGVMHRMHHKYSDTEKDPHSPHFFKDVFGMMLHTRAIFLGFTSGKNLPDTQFMQEYLPSWKKLDRIGHHFITRICFALCYVGIYVAYAPSLWWFLLLPFHFLMGPIQGAIVNWCGHKYGYCNYGSDDHSKNSTPFGLLLMGELFQNNHHHDRNNANFARRWFEFDMTYLLMKVLNRFRVIRLIPVV